ncbi:ArsR/SmtB family transcription factor [Pseudonocardia sp. CA-107938]|uniref:ArsR/SmtB family transcription factor n=1 Tax=Pseudonocardia sp. CA-107938 TaxID=3240021 RepID=UPI003D8A049D
MLDLDVITDPAAAGISLDPVRARILAELASAPGSASSLARALGIPRQKINYHLRQLEEHGLVRLVEERRRGGLTERVLEATAATYVISPGTLPGVAPDPDRAPDRLSARWLVAVAARTVREVGELLAGAAAAGKRLATFTATTEVRFASAADRAAFAEELAAAVTALVGRYHDESAPAGRPHRVVLAIHPTPHREEP